MSWCLRTPGDLDLTPKPENPPRHDLALAAIALGKTVISRKAILSSTVRPELSPHAIRHKAAIMVRTDIKVTKRFADKHTVLKRVLDACSSAEGSKWKVQVLSTTDQSAGLDCLADMTALIRRQRRLARAGGLWKGPPG